MWLFPTRLDEPLSSIPPEEFAILRAYFNHYIMLVGSYSVPGLKAIAADPQTESWDHAGPVLDVRLSARLTLGRLAFAQGFRDQFVGEDELGFRHVLDRQQQESCRDAWFANPRCSADRWLAVALWAARWMAMGRPAPARSPEGRACACRRRSGAIQARGGRDSGRGVRGRFTSVAHGAPTQVSNAAATPSCPQAARSPL